MISIKQLSYALAAAKTLHFKKAAELCNVSQSALSTALNELEKQLGLQIFERDNKKVLITPIGQEVLERAREILVQIEDLEHLAEGHRAPFSYPISIGAIPTIAPYLLPLIFPILNKRYPDATINVIEAQSHELVDLVKRGELDTAILALPYPLEGLLSLEFWQEDFYWVTHKSNALADQDEVTSEEIKQQNLMLLKDGHCLKDHILDVCKLEEKIHEQHKFEATSLTTLVQMTQGGLGSTLIPEMAKKQLLSSKKLSVAHLNEPSPHRKIAFIVRANYTRFSSVDILKNICEEALNKI